MFSFQVVPQVILIPVSPLFPLQNGWFVDPRSSALGPRVGMFYQSPQNWFAFARTTIQNQCSRYSLSDLINEPHKYLVPVETESYSYLKLPPFLYECACGGKRAFNRCKSQRRAELEEKLVKETLERFPPGNGERLVYMGFGSGGLLQDLINIGKLIRAGYKNLKIILIDPEFEERVGDRLTGAMVPNPLFEQFMFLINKWQSEESKIELHVFQNVREYRSAFPDDKAHVIAAIDIENYEKLFHDLMLCHKTLHDRGALYLASDVYTFCLGAKECFSLDFRKKMSKEFLQLTQKLEKDLSMLVKKFSDGGQKVVRYAQLGTEFSFFEWTRLLPMLAQSGCQTIEFSLIHPRARDEKGNPIGPNWCYTEENLQQFLTLFLPKNTELKVSFYYTIDGFKKTVDQSGVVFDMITWLGHETDTEQGVWENVRWIKEHVPFGNAYYGILVVSRSRLEKKEAVLDEIWRWNHDSGVEYLTQPTPADAARIQDRMK